MTRKDQVRENRLRRVAERRGWKLTKSRRRDPLALDYGQWRLVALDAKVKDRAFPDLDAVERFLQQQGRS